MNKNSSLLIKNSSPLRVAITGIKRNILKKELKRLLEERESEIKIKIDYRNPEIILCYGGDGSLLFSEREYPRIPKIFIHKKNDIKKIKEIIEDILKNKSKIIFKELPKLEVYVNNKMQDTLAMNDVNIHYTPPEALRFFLKIDRKIVTKELVGDGVVISTPFGSNGYFKSITRKTFNRGIGVAFNNTTERMKPIILDENSEIEIILTRGKGCIAIDNLQKLIKIKSGDSIKIRRAKEKARVLIFR